MGKAVLGLSSFILCLFFVFPSLAMEEVKANDPLNPHLISALISQYKEEIGKSISSKQYHRISQTTYIDIEKLLKNGIFPKVVVSDKAKNYQVGIATGVGYSGGGSRPVPMITVIVGSRDADGKVGVYHPTNVKLSQKIDSLWARS